MGPKTKSAHLLRWHYGERVTMGQFSNSFPKYFSYLCEYAFRYDLSCSFCEYPFMFHCLQCSPSCFDPDSLLLAYYWLGLSWIDCISSKPKLSISKNKQQETLHQQQAAGEAKHSAETTINFSTRLTCIICTHIPRVSTNSRSEISCIFSKMGRNGQGIKKNSTKERWNH